MDELELGEVALEDGLREPRREKPLGDLGLHLAASPEPPAGDQRRDGRGPITPELAELAKQYGHDVE